MLKKKLNKAKQVRSNSIFSFSIFVCLVLLVCFVWVKENPVFATTSESLNPLGNQALPEPFSQSGISELDLFIYQDTPYVAQVFQTVDYKLKVKYLKNGYWYTLPNYYHPGPISHCDFIVDQGIPYLAFSDSGHNDALKIIYLKDGFNWVELPNIYVSSQEMGFWIEGGIPYLAFANPGDSNRLAVYCLVNGKWSPVGEPSLSIGAASQISIYAEAGNLYVLYQDKSLPDMFNVIKYENTQWTKLGNINESGSSTKIGKLVVSSDIPYVVVNNFGQKTKVMRYLNTKWEQVGNVLSGCLPPFEPDLVFNNGIPYIAYRDQEANRLLIKQFTGSTWETLQATHSSLNSSGCSLCYLEIRNGKIYLLYTQSMPNLAYPASAYILSGSLPDPVAVTTDPQIGAPNETMIDEDGLLAYYRFENDLADSSGSGHDGTAVGSISYSPEGVSGKSLKMDKGGYVKIWGSETLNLGEKFTINAWIKLNPEENTINRYNTILFKDHPQVADYYVYKVAASGSHDVRLDLMQLTSGFEPVSSTDGVGSLDLASKWTMVTWVSDGDNLYSYLDGKLASTSTTGKQAYGVPFIDSFDSNLYIGNPLVGKNEAFNGEIDEIKLYNKALTGGDIVHEYQLTQGTTKKKIQLWIGKNQLIKDGESRTIDSLPMILKGRTMVPIRSIIEAMGGSVAYDSKASRIDLTYRTNTLTLWVDRYEAVLNGQKVRLEVAPTVISGRTMLPLRFAAESFGASVDWNKELQQITLEY